MLNMAEKLAFTLQEIAEEIGVHKNTVRNRLANLKDMLIMGKTAKRKRLYSPTEVEFIKTLFHNEVTGL